MPVKVRNGVERVKALKKMVQIIEKIQIGRQDDPDSSSGEVSLLDSTFKWRTLREAYNSLS